MKCSFPETTPSAAYRYGCRCERCRRAKSEENKRYRTEGRKRDRPPRYECQFPDLTFSSAYKNGCRCPDCKAHRRKVDRESRGKPLEQRAIGIQKKYPVPAGLIQKFLNKYLDEIGRDNDLKWEILGQELGISAAGACRLHYRYENREVTYMSFSQADKIITKLFGFHYWLEHDELRAIYEEHA